MPSDRASLQALKNLLTETDLLISTAEPLPENRTPRCSELLRAALALTDDLLNQTGKTAAAIMGHKGGTTTAQRGSDYFRELERQNLTIRMQMRRLTRLTNAFSKKWENLWAAYCLHFAYYNFCRIHQTLRVTPAMEAGITTRVWTLADLLA